MNDAKHEIPSLPLESSLKSIDTSLIILIILISSILGAFGGKYLALDTLHNKLTLIESQIPKIIVFDPGQIKDFDSQNESDIQKYAEIIKQQSKVNAENGYITLWGQSVINAPNRIYYKEGIYEK